MPLHPDEIITIKIEGKDLTITACLLEQVPYFVSMEHFNSPENSVEHTKTLVVENANEILYEYLRIIIHFLQHREILHKINDVGTLKGLKYTANYLGVPAILEECIKTEQHTSDVVLFLAANYPAHFIIKYYPKTQVSLFKTHGYTISDLKEAGYTVTELKSQKCSAEELFEAGFTLKELKEGGFSIPDLLSLTTDISKFKEIGIKPKELYKAYQLAYLYQGRIKTSFQDVIDQNCFTLEEYTSDFSIGMLKTYKPSWTLKDYLAAGYQLRDTYAEFSYKDYLDCNISLNGLKGLYSVWQLKEYGYCLNDFIQADFSITELSEAYNIVELHKGGFTIQQLINSPLRYLIKQVCSDVSLLKELNFTPESFKEAGFEAKDLIEVYTYAQLLDTYTKDELAPVLAANSKHHFFNSDSKKPDDEVYRCRCTVM